MRGFLLTGLPETEAEPAELWRPRVDGPELTVALLVALPRLDWRLRVVGMPDPVLNDAEPEKDGRAREDALADEVADCEGDP